jgi:hypothetical protein
MSRRVRIASVLPSIRRRPTARLRQWSDGSWSFFSCRALVSIGLPSTLMRQADRRQSRQEGPVHDNTNSARAIRASGSASMPWSQSYSAESSGCAAASKTARPSVYGKTAIGGPLARVGSRYREWLGVDDRGVRRLRLWSCQVKRRARMTMSWVWCDPAPVVTLRGRVSSTSIRHLSSSRAATSAG